MKTYNEILKTVTPEWLNGQLEKHSLLPIDLKALVGVTSQAVSEIRHGGKQYQNRVVLYLYFQLLDLENK